MHRSTTRTLAALTVTLAAATTAGTPAHAQEPARPAAPPPISPTTPAEGATPPPPAPNGSSGSATEGKQPDVAPPKDPERKTSVEPKVAEPPPPGRTTFDADPIADGAVVLVSVGFAGVLDLINGTGEIRPQQISPNFQTSQLLGIDRGAISQTIDSNASTYSNIGLGVAIGYAVLDPILTGVREHDVQSALVDGIMYAESLSLTYAMTNLAKVAVRRPRPIAYIEAEAHKGDPNFTNTSTDSSLSFFSGHAAITAAVGATATYLAFARSPKSVRPWITLIAAAGLSTFVSIERVRAGAHFPTDVIAGSIAGAGIGVVVPHLHRTEDIKQRRMWVGFAPAERGAQGGVMNVSGFW